MIGFVTVGWLVAIFAKRASAEGSDSTNTSTFEEAKREETSKSKHVGLGTPATNETKHFDDKRTTFSHASRSGASRHEPSSGETIEANADDSVTKVNHWSARVDKEKEIKVGDRVMIIKPGHPYYCQCAFVTEEKMSKPTKKRPKSQRTGRYRIQLEERFLTSEYFDVSKSEIAWTKCQKRDE